MLASGSAAACCRFVMQPVHCLYVDSLRRVVALCVLLTTIAACKSARRPGSQSAVIETVGDTTVVGNHGPIWPDTAALVPELVIGAVDQSEEYLFANIIALTVDDEGNVYVYDSNFNELRKYDSAGRFVRRIGREGGGPGEFRFVSGLAVLPDGRLVAVDPGNNRLNVYDKDGNALTHWPRPITRPTYGRFAIQTDSAGTLYYGLNPPLPTDGSPLPWPRPTFLRLDQSGEVADTIYVPSRFVDRCPVRSEQKYRSGFFDDLRARYLPKVKWAINPDGALIAGCPDVYRFEIVRPDGITRIVRESWTPVPVSAAELDNYTRFWTLQHRESGLYPGFVWTTDLGHRKPAYQRILVGAEGRLWLWTPQSSVELERPLELPNHWPSTHWQEPAGGVFDVFDADGRYLVAVRLPPTFSYTPDPGQAEPAIRGDIVWAVTIDEDDVPSLTRFRLSTSMSNN